MRAACGVDAFEPRVAALLTDTRHELWMSTVSAWELAMLAERGGLELRPDPEQWIAAAVAGLGLHEAPVTSAIALESCRVSLPTKDPAEPRSLENRQH